MIEEFLRVEGGHVLATLVRFAGDIDLAQDALQDATVVAIERWRDDPPPENAAAWLTTTARNKLLDRLRREGRRTDKEMEAIQLLAQNSGLAEERVDRLRLLFTCCHPALSPEARVALALRTVSGLTTPEIARAFLVPEATMAQRITRAKRKIKSAHIPYRVPDDHELPDRLDGVLAVLYLVFTTGHHAPSGALDARVDLAEEAIRSARELVALMPDEPEAAGLLALMLASHARRGARLDDDGEVVLLADQDRARWDRSAIAEASDVTRAAMRAREPGPYVLQAAIACAHGEAASYAETVWDEIVRLYRDLEKLRPSAVVRVNRAIAEGEALGPEAGLGLLDAIESPPVDWHLYWATRAEFLRRVGRTSDARDALVRALDLDCNDADRRLLERRLAALD